MKLLESELNQLATKIKDLENKRQILGSSISSIKDKLKFPEKDPDILEDKFVYKIEPNALEKIRVAGVDGGVVNARYHGANLVVGRAAAIIFDFKGRKLTDTEYFPSTFPDPEPIAFLEPMTNAEFVAGTGLARMKIEIELAAKAVEQYKPDIILLDGSILPYGTDRPAKGTGIYKNYEELVQAFKVLYEKCSNHNTLLAGVVEDSAGLRLTNLLKEKIVPGIIKSNEFNQETTNSLDLTKNILEKTNDSNIMYYILGIGERSCTFSYTREPEKHQILKDLKPYGRKISSFYMKPVEFDRPIRIDFINGKETTKTADETASIVYALSMHNETYGCPTILIEADARAKLSETDLDLIYQRLRDKVGDLPSLFKLRRELRPF